MWISLSWLGDYVALGARSPEQIGNDLTMRTALIEAIERRGEFSESVKVGRVLERQRHPNADRLSLCIVDVGEGDPIEIVCGAPNVDAGQIVAVATVGSELPGGFKIKRSKIRGITSNGMICSETELRLGDDHDGIMVLEETIEVGRPFREVSGVADVLFEIDNKSVTHRPDLWGHEGFARELAAIYDLPLIPASLDESLAAGDGPVDVRIEAEDLCGRYHALGCHGRLGGPSPGWIKRRLAYCGLRPRSLAVDVSNYVMLDLGQPTHPFDARHVAGGVIRVRRAFAREMLLTLDGEQRTLPADACMIADGARAIAIGGIIGGADSGVTEATEHVILEAAWFEPISVRRTSSALSLRTDALARFEKFLDPALAERGLRRFARVMRAVAPDVRIDATFASRGVAKQPSVSLRLRRRRVVEKLGVELSRAEVTRRLEGLGFAVSAVGDDFDVVVPSFRATRDVTIEDDLIEEVGRIGGYETIPNELPYVACRPVELEPTNRAWRSLVDLLTDRLGFAEVASYPYVDDGVLSRAGGSEDAPYLRLLNPLQASANRLRRSQVPWMLEFIDRNVKRVEEVRLFECGRVFHPRTDGELPYEPHTLTVAWAERVTKKDGTGRVLRRMRGALDDVALRLERSFGWRDAESPPAWAHPGRAAGVSVGDQSVGLLAQVHPDVADRFGWQGEVAIFELDLSRIVAGDAAPRRYSPPSKFPPARIDISFVAPFDLRYADVRDRLFTCAADLVSVDLVDEYVAGMTKGERSLTLRLSFQAADRTLNDHEVMPQLAAVKRVIEEAGGAVRA